jgi:hypothetical protein
MTPLAKLAVAIAALIVAGWLAYGAIMTVLAPRM